jgi:ABC-type glycerol-3-phosphate transport system substrate-binding protein
MLRMSGNNCTDVVGLFATEATTVIEKDLAADITDMVKTWDKYQNLNESVIRPITYEGRIYGLPIGGVGGSYVMTLFYNKDLFNEAVIEKPPDTWEELVETAKKLTDRSKGQAGFGILGEKGGAGWHFLNWVWQSGGDFEVKKEGKWTAVFDSPEAVRALQFVKDLRWKHQVLQDDILCDNDDLFEYFSAERIAMAIFTPEYLVHLVEKYEMPFEKIGIALLPAGPGGRANQMGGAYNIINPAIPREKQEWAFKAMTFDYELDTIELKCQTMKRQDRIFGFGVIPVFHGEYQDKVEGIVDKYRTIPGQKKLMREAAKYVHPEPPYFSQQLYSEFLGPSVQEVLTNEKSNPEKLLREAAHDFQSRFLDKITIKR